MAKTAKNKNLHKAKDSKKDEFYTQLSDIERELRYYKHHFKDKVVYCNCDDPGVHWFTNLDISKRHEDLILYKNYTEEEYPKYENFDAINVNKTKDIPVDYNGYMGVPITFLDKYNPDQFEIIGLGISNSGIEIGVQPYKEEHKKYRKEIQKRGAVDGDLYMMTNGVVDVPYARIIIKNKRL